MDNINNITRIDFPESYNTAFARGLTQWDQGQKLEISGLDISNEIVEVHFSLEEYGSAKRMLGIVNNGIISVDIPPFILEGPDTCSDYNAYAWIYLTNESHAETEREIVLRFKGRARPDEYVSEEDLDFLQQLENYINGKLDKTGHAPNMYLGTDEKGNVVTRESSGGVTDEQVKSAVEEYLEENPIDGVTDEEREQWNGYQSHIDNLDMNKADRSEIPIKTSELENDSGFITKKDLPNIEIPDVDLTNYATKEYVENYSVVLSHDGNGNATIKGLVVLLDGNEVEY